MECSNNLRQLALGVHNYESTYKVVPSSFRLSNQLSWTVALVPFLEATDLFYRIDQGAGPYYSRGKNDPHGLERLSYHHCPSSTVIQMQLSPPHSVDPLDLVPANSGKAPYTIHYYGISGPTGTMPDGSTSYPVASNLTHEGSAIAGSGVFQWNTPVRFSSITDGMSYTLCLGEMSWESPRFGTRYRSWLHGSVDGSYAAGCRNIARPINSHRNRSVITPLNDMPMGSQHTGGAQFALSDGSVTFLHEQMDFAVYQALSTRNGNEKLRLDGNTFALPH
ncbi:MAG: DUF1559 family PulG-like putative transporter [Aureliella sp.]